jgi:[ribosomal protein S5]-alanine N-acetyltransferase
MSGDLGDILVTPRLRLVPATPAMIDAELERSGRLGRILEAVIPPDWPPEHHDRATLEFWRERLADPAAAGWWLHYAVLTESEPTVLVGSVGYKGPPEDGVAEIGYSVVPSWQRRGLATEASRALIGEAWARGADVVVAHALEHLTPSIGVLRKLGFERTESSQPDEVEFLLRRG